MRPTSNWCVSRCISYSFILAYADIYTPDKVWSSTSLWQKQGERQDAYDLLAPVYNWLCVQQRLACSVGDNPTRVRIRSPVAWMAGERETHPLKPIDKAIVGMAASHRAAA